MPVTANPFAGTRIVPRRKRQRRDPALLPVNGGPDGDFGLFEPLPAGYGLRVLGTFEGSTGFGGPATYEWLVVTRPDGLEVPAYRVHAPDFDYNIVQSFNFKAG